MKSSHTSLHLQSERAARKATVLQMATMYTAMGGTLLNVGVTLSSQGNQIIANGSFIGAGRVILLVKVFLNEFFILRHYQFTLQIFSGLVGLFFLLIFLKQFLSSDHIYVAFWYHAL